MVLYNPFTKFTKTQGWSQGSHRYPYNAVDYATPVGYRFGAPDDGVYVRLQSNLSREDPTAGGHYGYLLLPDGDRIYFVHLDHHIAESGSRVKQGDILAATGNTGYVRPTPTKARPFDGAHVHTYGKRKDGTRFDWTVGAVAALPKPASGGSVYDELRVVLAPLNLRESPRDGKVVKVLPAGSVVRAGSAVKGWIPVKQGRKTGWVAAEFTTKRTQVVRIDASTLRTKPASLQKSKANPSPARRITRLKRGTRVTVLAVNGKTPKAAYWKVRVGLRVGWVIGKHLK